MSNGQELWTIDELGAQAALALAAGHSGAANGRVREVPDVRTIRYYTTLGLLDRPVAMRGRVALYGRKHLLQLVAIKRLQAQGLTLVEIQQRLLGLSERELAAIAQVSEQAERRARANFWKREAISSAASDTPRGVDAILLKQVADAEVPRSSPPVLQGLPLRKDVTLLFASQRPLTAEDMQALQAAAGPLLKCMKKRRLLGPRDKETP